MGGGGGGCVAIGVLQAGVGLTQKLLKQKGREIKKGSPSNPPPPSFLTTYHSCQQELHKMVSFSVPKQMFPPDPHGQSKGNPFPGLARSVPASCPQAQGSGRGSCHRRRRYNLSSLGSSSCLCTCWR